MSVNERKLVEAMRLFFEKNILQSVASNEKIMSEWKHLTNIMMGSPIDYGQIDFYLLMANKTNNAPSSSRFDKNIQGAKSNEYIASHDKSSPTITPPSSAILSSSNHSPINSPSSSQTPQMSSNTNSPQRKRKNLSAQLEAFQGLLAKNQ